MSSLRNQRTEYIGQVYVPNWSEFIGILNSFHVENDALQLVIDNETLFYPNDSDEAKYLLEKLEASIVGRRIAVLRTDIPDKSLILRLVD